MSTTLTTSRTTITYNSVRTLLEAFEKSRAFSVYKKTRLERRAFRFGMFETHFVLPKRTFRFGDYTTSGV